MPLLETKGAASAQGFGGIGASSGPVNYIEDVFSTYLYTGNGSTQTITNGIGLSTYGGLVWIKGRSYAGTHELTDTVRGATIALQTNSTAAQSAKVAGLTAFTSTGFTVGSNFDYNSNTNTLVSWTFREQPKFFDVVTYTGDGTTKAISHSLGSTPGCIFVKATSAADNWFVYHRSLNDNSGNPYFLYLNTTAAQDTGGGAFGTPTSTTFTVRNGSTNTNGVTYVAYLFAHNAGGFGLTGSDNVISCGSFTNNSGGYSPFIDLGYEPQWILTKRTDSSTAGEWKVMDNMRGMPAYRTQALLGVNPTLFPNSTNAEADSGYAQITPTGFYSGGTANATYIYIAIRRGPMKVPTSGTSVYTPITRSGNSTATTVTGVGFAPDLVFEAPRTNSGGNNWVWFDRLRGGAEGLSSDNAGAAFTNSVVIQSDSLSTTMDGFRIQTANPINASGNTYVYYPLKRAPSFFDEVCYTGTGSATTQAHNLGVVPELMIVKWRSGATGDNWNVYHSAIGATGALYLNKTDATVGTAWNNTSPTATQFTVGTQGSVSSATYVAYLFATCAGVSKVGSYTGTGTTLQINCGFTGGARFVLIKRTNSTGDWYVWDSARGIVAGNDPYLLLNSTAAEVTTTDYVDTYSAGFEISSTAPAAINANGGTFIFLAIA